jgi:hypothetical protein
MCTFIFISSLNASFRLINVECHFQTVTSIPLCHFFLFSLYNNFFSAPELLIAASNFRQYSGMNEKKSLENVTIITFKQTCSFYEIKKKTNSKSLLSRNIFASRTSPTKYKIQNKNFVVQKKAVVTRAQFLLDTAVWCLDLIDILKRDLKLKFHGIIE